jgi:hypothetical protein
VIERLDRKKSGIRLSLQSIGAVALMLAAAKIAVAAPADFSHAPTMASYRLNSPEGEDALLRQTVMPETYPSAGPENSSPSETDGATTLAATPAPPPIASPFISMAFAETALDPTRFGPEVAAPPTTAFIGRAVQPLQKLAQTR